jgi:hypothetical protein
LNALIKRHIADVGDTRHFERNDLGQRVVVEDIARLVADFARTVSRAATLGEAQIGRQTDKGDIDFTPVVAEVGAEERGNSRERLDIHELAVRHDPTRHVVEHWFVHTKPP